MAESIMAKRFSSPTLRKTPRRRLNHTGQSLTEYGFILALVVVFCIAALQLFGQNLSDLFNNSATAVQGVATSMP